MLKAVHSGPRSGGAIHPVHRLLGHLNCTSADSGPFPPALLPQPWPAKPLKLDSPKLLAQGQLEPRLLQALPPPIPALSSWAKSAVLTAAGLQQRRRCRDPAPLLRAGAALCPHPRPDGHLLAAAQPAPGRPDRTAALIGAASESLALFRPPFLEDNTSLESRAGGRRQPSPATGE